MEQQNVDLFIMRMNNKFPKDKIMLIKSQLEKLEESKFSLVQSLDYKDPQTALILSIFLGGLGVDRFMLGQIGAGIGKLLTLGGFGIWTIVDWFTISSTTREVNFQKFVNAASQYNTAENNGKAEWYDKTWIVTLLCIFFFPVGLYALWQNRSIAQGWKVAVTILIASVVFFQLGNAVKDVASKSANTTPSQSEESSEESVPQETVIKQGEVLHTQYFDIVANKVELSDMVDTGNEFADLQPEQGVSYLIINASFKNIDTESRGAMEGSVWINYNGKDYEFDKAEAILLKGWGMGLGFKQINPLTKITTNIVYKIPSEIKGEAYWQPGRTESDQRIFLGNLK
jgi:TM2 domain-containing membrane protein YozV